MERDSFDLSQFPDAALQYTSFGGSQCALPFLTDAYGLYYNVDMFEEAGITEPPTTLSELADVAKQLTVFAPDGSIERAGIVMATGYYETTVLTMGSMFGVEWYSEDGTESAIDDDPNWTAVLRVAEGLHRRRLRRGGLPDGRRPSRAVRRRQGDEFSTRTTSRRPRRDEPGRRVAHGVHRGRGAGPQLRDGAVPGARRPGGEYGSRRRSAARSSASRGVGQSRGGVAAAAVHGHRHRTRWSYMANNVRNVPTTIAALESPDLDVNAAVPDVPGHLPEPGLALQAASAIGSADQTTLADFAAKWQAGAATDLQGGLQQVAQQIDDQLAQAAAERRTTSAARAEVAGIAAGAGVIRRRPRRRNLKRGLTMLLFMSPWIIGFGVLILVSDALEPLLLVHEVRPALGDPSGSGCRTTG